VAIRIGIVGIGKIARDQHLPVIAASPDFELVAAASRNGRVDDVENFASLDEMLAASDLDAVALCQPPQVRFAAAHRALSAGKHVFLEKPPGATLAELRILEDLARANGVTLFASWHSRFAAGVEPARQWLAGKTITAATIEWKEDVRHWHPGQAWIWEPGGMGVFDPGINALSIASAILPPFYLVDGTLEVPENRFAPIAAMLRFSDAAGVPIGAVFEWRQLGPQTWDIRVETEQGELMLSKGGNELFVDGQAVDLPPEAEYRGLYDRFASLIAGGTSEVDAAPFIHVADAFLRCERKPVEAFHD
jgi:D-galactose 1-dehydrogenase